MGPSRQKMVVALGALSIGAAAWLACTSPPPDIQVLPPAPRTAPAAAPTPPPPAPPASTVAPAPPPPEEDSTDVEVCKDPGPAPAANAPQEAQILHAVCPKGVD